ncbi:MAG: hypothetical protein J6Q58_02595, partial [Clostridia bacterium]|nr:hypothetical protein [Clostridia bacterium]
MNKNAKKILIGILIVIIAVGSFVGGYLTNYYSTNDDLRAIRDLITKYKNYYYYDDGDLVKEISDAILDEYSTYYTKEEYSQIISSAKGNYKGIGLSFNSKTLEITTVVGNSPAENAGVKVGGILSSIDAGSGYIDISNSNDLNAVLKAINDDKEFKIRVKYGEKYQEFTVAKRKYKRTYVHYYDELGYYGFNDKSGEIAMDKLSDETVVTNSTVGYLIYDSFNGTENDLNGSAKQIEYVLNKFKEDKKENIIIDLRDNGGGYMDILSKVSSHFIDAGDGNKVRIAVAKDKYGNEEIFNSSKCDYSSYNFKNIIILANENSASASEAFIGAVLDYDKQDIVKVLVSSSKLGNETVYKTYGKGIMQSTYVN